MVFKSSCTFSLSHLGLTHYGTSSCFSCIFCVVQFQPHRCARVLPPPILRSPDTFLGSTGHQSASIETKSKHCTTKRTRVWMYPCGPMCDMTVNGHPMNHLGSRLDPRPAWVQAATYSGTWAARGAHVGATWVETKSF